MAGQGYGQVDERGFAGFAGTLEAGVWGAISTKKHEATGEGYLKDAARLPQEVGWKLRLSGAVGGLVSALASRTDASEEDEAWDRLQRRLAAQVALHETDDDPAVVAAAGRVRKALLLGDGTGQTSLSHEREVEFGRTQGSVAGRAPLKADVELLGLRPLLGAIAKATEKLAAAQGMGQDEKATRTRRWKQVKASLQECVAAFNGVHDALAWTIARTEPGQERTRLESLLAPMEALLERHVPVGGGSPQGEGKPEEPPKPPTK